ncbi:MAG: ribosome biogenesis GTPase Der [Candidatus Dependentiae bacterium]|nr:ribosome biogenesis GTPase Der [Candidatus Dependentiae bacterium]
MNLMPKVVIVGRTNVGKSSLFNRIAPKVKSLTLDLEGVTRDMITDFVEWNGVKFELVDTGGIDLCKKADEMTCLVTQKVKIALEQASLLLFVVDGQTGIAEQDMHIRNFLHNLKKPVFVLVNKVDTFEHEENIGQFHKFGFDNIYGVSAAHGRSIGDLLDRVVEVISQTKPTVRVMDEEPEFKVAFLGRPNAGKSSLMNLLLDQDFSIVSPVAGTTREALRKRFAFNKQVVELIDTAGVRRKSGVNTELESMMVTNALQAAKRAHIVLLLIDVQEPELTSQELKLTSYAFENGSAVIVLFNKMDLLDEEKQEYLDSSKEEYKYFLKKLETLSISCKTGKNVGKVLPLVQDVWERFGTRFSERYLTDLFMDALVKTPLYKNGQRLTFHRAHQVGTAPIRIELIVRNTEIFEENHRAFFENILRKAKDLKSIPLFFYAKAKRDLR